TKQEEKGAKTMGSQEFVKKEEPKTTDGTKNLKDFTPAKVLKLTEEQKNSLIGLRDSLEKRSMEISQHPYIASGSSLIKNKDKKLLENLFFEHHLIFDGLLLIDYALECKWEKVESQKLDIIKYGEKEERLEEAKAFIKQIEKVMM
ncbi:MAG: hypothetical protein ABIH83_04415, partial [Candidatus Micrarchaeota archaeon]